MTEERKPTPRAEQALQALQKSLSGEGMSVQQAGYILGRMQNWSPDGLYENVPVSMRKRVVSALLITDGIRYARQRELVGFLAGRDGDD